MSNGRTMASATDPYRTRYHRDGHVTVWDVHTQSWLRTSDPSDRILSSMSTDEIAKIVMHCRLGKLTKAQAAAVRSVPACVSLDDWDGTWEHVVFRVEHPVDIRSEGGDWYAKREAVACRRWLQRHAPSSLYAQIDIR